MKMNELNEVILSKYRELCDDNNLSEEDLLKSITSLAIFMMDACGCEEVSIDNKTLTLYDGD